MRELVILLLATRLAAAADVAALRADWQAHHGHALVAGLLRAAQDSSPALRELEETIAPGFAEFLEHEAVLLSPDEELLLTQAPVRQPYGTMRAWVALRKPNAAADALATLPLAHPWRARLALVAAQARLALGDVQGARRLAVENDLPLLRARLAFARGEMEAAESAYLAVPRSSPDFLTAQEEVMWIWLRRGDTSRLRGAVKTFSLALFVDRFLPEAYVARAISNLKLCYYGDARADVMAFARDQARWGARIDAQIASTSPERPPEPDWLTALAERAVERRRAEGDVAETGRMEALRTDQYRRQWRTLEKMEREAIRKMQFVKVELLRQPAPARPDSDASHRARESARIAVTGELDSTVSFPYDGVVWPDELFRLRSTAASECL